MENHEHGIKGIEFDPQKLIMFSKNDVIRILYVLYGEIRGLEPSYKDEYSVSRGRVLSLIEDMIEDLK